MGGRRDDGSLTPKEKRRPLPVIREDDPDENDNNFLSIPDTRSEFEGRRKSGGDSSALSKLKETTARLKLSTRRPSYVAWQAQYLKKPSFPSREELEKQTDGKLTVERKQRINDALDWLRNELQEMRTHDQALARQLLTIRQDIHQLKLRRSCEEHQEMLEDVQSELEELEELSDVLDLPNICLNDNPLKQLGVTRMNISSRRFSMC